MAKVVMPLMSAEASGSFAGQMVFGKWKGRQYARQLVIPSNPNSAGQESVRNRLRVLGEAQRWVNSTDMVAAGETQTDKQRIMGATPGGFAWNGYLVEIASGKGGLNYTAAEAAYNALAAGEKTAWDTAADNLDPPINDVYQTVEGGTAGAAAPNGKVWFAYQFALARMGLMPTPGATPPTYA